MRQSLLFASALGSIVLQLCADAALLGIDVMTTIAWAGAIGVAGTALSAASSKAAARLRTGARRLSAPSCERDAWLLAGAARAAAAGGIRVPEIAVYQSGEPNAFTAGLRRDHALIALSSSLVEQMDRGQIDAVLAHEIAHIVNGDMLALALLQGVLDTFVHWPAAVLGYYLDRLLPRGADTRHGGPGQRAAAAILLLTAGLLATLLMRGFCRRCEFHADRWGACTTGRGNMIAALRGLQGNPPPARRIAPSFIASAAFVDRARGLLMTHPPLQRRIAALQTPAPQIRAENR
jgi:heat shock protein HtpX